MAVCRSSAQAPVFIILYQVLRGIGTRSGGSASGIGRVAGLIASDSPFKPWKLHDQVFSPQHLSTGSEMYKALHSSTKMSFLGVDLSISPLDALKLGITTAIPFLALVAVMLVSQIIQNRQIQGRNTNAQVNPQQQAIMKFLPFMLPIFSFTLPAGLGLYYFAGPVPNRAAGLHHPGGVRTHHASMPVETTSTEKTTTGDGKPAKKPASNVRQAPPEVSEERSRPTEGAGPDPRRTQVRRASGHGAHPPQLRKQHRPDGASRLEPLRSTTARG